MNSSLLAFPYADIDFSEYKSQGKTPMYFGRPLGRLLDTVYFTQSHHSRFLQVADLLVYMAGRYENWDDVPDRSSSHQLNLLAQRVALPTPIVGSTKPREVHRKGRVVLAAGQPCAVMDDAQGAQRLYPLQLLPVKRPHGFIAF